MSVAEAKLHLRVTDDSQDLLIQALISAACRAAETATRRQLLHAQWRLVLDKFPQAGFGTPTAFENAVNIPGYAAMLPHSPCVSIISIKYLDTGSVQQTLDPSTYTLNNTMEPALVSPVFGQIWPVPLAQMGSVQIDYVAGYASPMAVVGTPTSDTPATQIKVTGPARWNVADVVEFYNSGGALPTGLSERTPYLVKTANGSIYEFTDMAGADISLTDAGTGSNFLGVVPEGIRTWMKLRIGSLYSNREEVAVLSRGSIGELPYVDGLLDPFRTSLP